MEIEQQINQAWKALHGSNPTESTLYLLYDGDCMLCQNAAQYYRLKEAAGEICLVNLRGHAEITSSIRNSGLDPNEGVLVLHKKQVLFGAEALCYLSRLGELRAPGGSAASRLLQIRTLSNLLYPLMKALRALINWAKGVGRL